MKKGSVVVDVSIDQGGCFETSEITSHKNPTFIKHGVVHYCVPNIASRVSRTASMAISNILTPILLRIAEEGGVEYTTNVSSNGTIGTSGATVSITIPKKPLSLFPGSAIGELHYYETVFTDTGGKIYTPEWKGELQLTKTGGVDDVETRFETKLQEDIFKNSFFMRAGLTFSVDNGDLKVELN